MNEWFFPNGALARPEWQTVVDPAIPGWVHTGLRVAELGDGEERELPAAAIERLVIPLAGAFEVEYTRADASGVVVLDGRASVFDGPSDVAYLGGATRVVIRGTGRVAIAEAPTTSTLPARHIAKSDVPVELRGAGASSRQVHNFGTPGMLEADRFIVCEVITPADNWSSYPPHKHDELIPGAESRLEEIYYFEAAVTRGVATPVAPDPFGLMRANSSDAGEISVLAEVRTGDVVLVPYGWHGPCGAVPGYDLYYLNVMAGPDPERVWNISDDPAHGWVRETWADASIDARLPYTDSRAVENDAAPSRRE